MSSKFGWSYPPGVSSLPWDVDYPCEVCGLFPDAENDPCICPECPECGAYGDPHCYENHGLTRSPEQIASLAAREAKWAEEKRREEDAWEKAALAADTY